MPAEAHFRLLQTRHPSFDHSWMKCVEIRNARAWAAMSGRCLLRILRCRPSHPGGVQRQCCSFGGEFGSPGRPRGIRDLPFLTGVEGESEVGGEGSESGLRGKSLCASLAGFSLLADGQVIYRLRRPWPTPRGATHLLLEPLDFLRATAGAWARRLWKRATASMARSPFSQSRCL
jgi:hypothetical protein